MAKSSHALQPLLAHLYGPALGRILVHQANAQGGERILIIGSDTTAPKGWTVQDDEPPAAVSPYDQTHELPIIDFCTWQGAEDFRREVYRWDVLIGFPPQGHMRGGLWEFLNAAADTANANSRAILLLLAKSLASGHSREREALLATGTVPALIFPSTGVPSRRHGLPSTLPIVATQWRPGTATHVPSAEVVAASSPGVEETVFRIPLSTEQPWTLAGLDPERIATLRRWARDGNARRLDEIVELPRPDTDLDNAEVVLHPGQITPSGLDLSVETRAPDERRDGRLIRLRAGDIVGRTIGDPHWNAVWEADLQDGLASTRHVTVLRPKSVDSRYLVAFLRSDAATGQLAAVSVGATIPRVPMRALRQLLVPMLSISSKALDDSDSIYRYRATSRELADTLERRYRAAFDKPDGHRVTAALSEAADDAAMAADLVRRVTDPLHRARQFLPHPLARTLRVYENHRRAGSVIDVHQDLLRFGETAIIMLGAVGLAYAVGPGRATIDEEWQRSLTRGGVSLGTWLRAANLGAENARRTEEPLGGLASALSTNSPLNEVLQTFLEARNEHAHGGGPRSQYEHEQRNLELEESLYTGIKELSPLARSDWFVVERLAWSADPGTFTIFGRSLNGEHPDFDNWSTKRRQPLESDVVHVRLGELDLPMHGFCMLRACSLCLHEELYYPDRLRGSMVRLRSLDRGHASEMSTSETCLPVLT